MVLTPHSVGDVTQNDGLDYIVENGDYTEKLALALESKNCSVKKQVFELLSALCVYSADGYNRTLEALECFKKQKNERYRFKFIVNELQHGPTVDYQTAVIAFVNCLILATSDLQERIRIRSEFLGLKLAQILNDLRYKKKDCSDLAVQIDVFDEQRESDESQLSPTLLNNIDLSSPLEVFDAILRQIADTPLEIPFLSILQHLLRIDHKEPISDLIWDAAERLVHRATLLETKSDALRLISPSHQSKLSLNKPKGGERCSCTCHKDRRTSSATFGDFAAAAASLLNTDNSNVTSPPPPPPPPPPMMVSGGGPVMGGGPPPPPAPPPPFPPPPLMPPSSKSPSFNSSPANNAKGNEQRLPQQSIPAPKAKMRTVNWNKIPTGQIFNSDKDNLWINFAKNYKTSASTLDWEALEGLFCIQTEKASGSSPNLDASKNNSMDRPQSKRESNQILLLDAKRSLNINIFLKQFRTTNKDIIKHIMEANSEEIGSERLRGLLKILPSKDEIEMLKAVPQADKSRVGSAEKFLLELIGLKAYRLRIEAMLLREDLDSCFHSLDSSIDVILQASQEIKNAKHFQDVIFMILVAGNFLNSGGYAGDAIGVKLSSLQKIADIRGNQPGISLLNFISMQAETKNPDLLTFAKHMVSLEEASKCSIDQIKGELLSLKKKVELICEQLVKPETPQELCQQLGDGFQEARLQIEDLEDHLLEVELSRVDLAQFFCEDLQTFKLEDCFKILHSFIVRWNQAAVENKRRKQLEEEARQRKKIREEQFQKRLQLGWETPQSVENFNNTNKTMVLNPEDDIFIACSPRVVRRRLGSNTDSAGNHSGGNTPDSLTVPSPDVTPNGSLRRRRSRVPSDEDETGLMDFLRASGQDGSRERKGPDQYGSLDRSWSRKTRRRPNLMDFVNDDRERPVSPATGFADAMNAQSHNTDASKSEFKTESPAREWRERIAAWFVDLENGGSAEIPQRRPPPRRLQQRRLNLDSVDPASRGLATLPEGEMGQEDNSVPPLHVYQRVYPDRRPSVKLNTDVVGAMEAIEEVQSPTKERPTHKKLFERTLSQDSTAEKGERRIGSSERESGGRRSLIESLGAKNHNDKLVLYIPEKSLPGPKSGGDYSSKLKRSPSVPGESSLSSSSRLSNGNNPTVSGSGGGDGFDRNSSFRKSRRYKKESETPTTTLMRSASLYSNVRPKTAVTRSTEDYMKPRTTSSSAINDELKVSIRPARNTPKSPQPPPPPSASEDLRSTRVHSPSIINSTNGTSIVQIKGPTTPRDSSSSQGGRPTSQNYTIPGNKSYLSSSPGTAERDEGFEESHSSLSETNSQSESHNIPFSAKVIERKPLQRLGGSFRVNKSRPIPNHTEMSSSTSLNHANNNNNLSNRNNSSSAASLQSSRSSLSSQATVKENPDASRAGALRINNATTTASPTNRLGGDSFTTRRSHSPATSMSLSNNSISKFPSTTTDSSKLAQKNMKNNHGLSITSHNNINNNNNNSGTPMMTTETKKSSSKGLAPRILSFMRPTASSTAQAKDKADLLAKNKSMRKSFR
ncbi:FH2 domain-containing protein 1 isoform X2 [Folsomia candida]|uniref:FH2 domain-containing protein 1 isoform X2 n=1 Tax=Folsomia candida TaxID=158441 RepID=UPI000B8F23E8|nr:FH2 domain-containing protein 1 isoform X2 [Folsomia candida]